MYQECAKLYDTPMRDQFSRQCAKLCRKVFQGRSIRPPAAVSDLGCGTGLLCKLLQDDGFTLTGVDLSEQMLDIARGREYNSQPEFLLHDIRTFRRREAFQAVLCFGDVLNHLLETSDLEELFTSACFSLSPGGVFIADTTSREAYLSGLWDVEGLVEEREGLDVSVSGSFDAETNLGTIEVTASGVEGTVTETVWQRYHPDDLVGRLLKEAGFSTVICQKFNPIPGLSELEAIKFIWLAIKG